MDDVKPTDKRFPVAKIEGALTTMVALMELKDRQTETMCDLMLALAQRTILPKGTRVRVDYLSDSAIVSLDKFDLIYRRYHTDKLKRICMSGEHEEGVLPHAIAFPFNDKWLGFCRRQMIYAPTQKLMYTKISRVMDGLAP